jgi:hypothetical protein
VGTHSFGEKQKMKKLVTLTVAALLLASGSQISLAQVKAGGSVDAGAAVGAAAGTTDGGAAVGGNANVAASANAGADASSHNFGSVISSLNSSGSATVDLGSITDQSKVNIVLISKLKANASADAKALDNALSKNASSLTKIRADAAANAAIKAKLEANKLSADKVVAVATAADGSITVYVDDRA